MASWEHYYQVLGLDWGASLDEVNQAYHDLAFIWHPDRLPSDNQRLRAKATAKLQEINRAREELHRLSELGDHPSPTPQVSHEQPVTPPKKHTVQDRKSVV